MNRPLCAIAVSFFLTLSCCWPATSQEDDKTPCGTICNFGSRGDWAEIKKKLEDRTKGESVKVDILKASVPVKDKKGIRRADIEIVKKPAERLVVDLDRRWTPGQAIVIQFLDHTDDEALLEMVEGYASQWEEFANLRFVFVRLGETPEPKEVHAAISFDGKGCWSRVGTDSLQRGDGPSMNLEYASLSNEKSMRRHVLHEFGHVLGFHHEHQSPKGGIKWKPGAREYFMRESGWSREQVQRNIFDPLRGNIAATGFDRLSIMLYYFPPQLYENEFEIQWNTELSWVDKLAASVVYPADDLSDDLGAYAKTAPAFMKRGATVCWLDEKSPLRHLHDSKGNRFGLAAGSVVVSLDGRLVKDGNDFKNYARGLESGFTIKYFDPDRNALIEALGPEKGDQDDWPVSRGPAR